tara:strand:- start:230 stop:637 length:408 start_codon:yes stop_codon:yes gene_type:complete
MSNQVKKYENMKRRRYVKSKKQRDARDKMIETESELLKSKLPVEEEEDIEEEETEEEKELREKEEINITNLLTKYIIEENKGAEDIRRLLNRKPELFQHLKMTFILDKMKELNETKIKILIKNRLKTPDKMNFLL